MAVNPPENAILPTATGWFYQRVARWRKTYFQPGYFLWTQGTTCCLFVDVVDNTFAGENQPFRPALFSRITSFHTFEKASGSPYGLTAFSH